MVKVGYRDDSFELVELDESWSWGHRKVGCFKRKTRGRVYESPKIILDRHYKKFVGKSFRVYNGRAIYESKGYGRVPGLKQEGDCIILFFPDQWNKQQSPQKGV